jgi:hypothetical protein
MNTLIPPPLGLGRPSQRSKRYKLGKNPKKNLHEKKKKQSRFILNPFFTIKVIIQNPIRARCCGFGEKDRRPVDPPPILQLFIEESNGVLRNAMYGLFLFFLLLLLLFI